MYDDRLEIESPGRFPNIITADNIMYTRFSRNKTISRVMTEFEWVRELNEGVKKIYSDMDEAGLPEPEYIETPNTVRLILKNNIDERTAYRTKALNEALNGALNEALNAALNEEEQTIIKIVSQVPQATQREIADKTGFSRAKVQRIMKKLIDNKIIMREGSKKSGVWKIVDHSDM